MTGEPCEDLSALVGDPAVAQQVLDRLPIIVAALQGPELRYVVANSAARTFTGRETLLGLPLVEAVPEIAGQQIADLFTQVLASGEPRSLREWRTQLDRPDGGGPVEVFIDFNVVPWRDGHGALVG